MQGENCILARQNKRHFCHLHWGCKGWRTSVEYLFKRRNTSLRTFSELKLLSVKMFLKMSECSLLVGKQRKSTTVGGLSLEQIVNERWKVGNV